MASSLVCRGHAALRSSRWRAVGALCSISRGLCDGGRYVDGQGFVPDDGYAHEQQHQQQQQQWPPTQGGFVPNSVDSYSQAPLPPTQGGFVPHSVASYGQAPAPTQGGFVAQNAGFENYAQQQSPAQGGYAAPPPMQGYEYAAAYPVQYLPPYAPPGYALPPPPMPHFVPENPSPGWMPPTPPPPPSYHADPYMQQPQYHYYPPVQADPNYNPQTPPLQSHEPRTAETHFYTEETTVEAGSEPTYATSSIGADVLKENEAKENEAVVQEDVPNEKVIAQENEVSLSATEELPAPEEDPAAVAADKVSAAGEEHNDAEDEPDHVPKEAGIGSHAAAEKEKIVEEPKPDATKAESFLDILTKANLSMRQSKPRSQIGYRSQRKFARLHNLPRQILKTDIIHYFSELSLQKENIYVHYDERFQPLYVQIAFDSNEALRTAQRVLQTKGRLGGRVVRMETADQLTPISHQITDTMKEFMGRMLLVLNLPPEGRPEDLERFFDGFAYDPSALAMLEPINMILPRLPREGNNRLVRRAAVGFTSSLEAMRALREKQGDFILNDPVELRLIQ